MMASCPGEIIPLPDIVNRTSPAYKRVCEIGGFSIEKCELLPDPVCAKSKLVRFSFKCVCGGYEYAQMRIDNDTDNLFGHWFYNGKVDCAKILEDVKANGIYHLIADGYSDEDIVRLRKAYNTTLDDVRFKRNPKEFLEQKEKQACQLMTI